MGQTQLKKQTHTHKTAPDDASMHTKSHIVHWGMTPPLSSDSSVILKLP